MAKKEVVWLGTPTEADGSELSSPFTSRIGGSAVLFREAPTYSIFNCPKCRSSRWVSLLTQIYAPLDVYDRIVYVLICSSCSEGKGSFCFAVRSQNFNPSYVQSSPAPVVGGGEDEGITFVEDGDWGDDDPKYVDEGPNEVCITNLTCTTMADECKVGSPTQSTDVSSVLVPHGTKVPVEGFCYPCFVLNIFEEPPKPKLCYGTVPDQLLKAQQTYGEDAVETTVVEDEDEPLAEKLLRKYVDRIGRVPSQCVRWGPGQKPLRSSPAPIVIPRCPRCSNERRYELQLTSPIIYFLTKGKEEKDHSLHFGSVLVYTCGGNCNVQPYSLEHCVVEDEV
ncbi:Programmed cell death protein 2, C-terminal putative domain containing protein, putative [Trypanosoma equiperdum]|uniref:Programmed cell death protein 2 C-terminal domain-containing protein n=2 Tax=Trypanozoon TaxID=39700 RepID=Q580E6_TRYB2|nr:hypothetical protein, conserved [Trypanosoma brucei brucei TREU927]AAX80909.1 hypothetical protein, conserved [Trypanosoma brucei]AAZ10709.1 hypothetical protein, conserved [Trypanosoma brucei brucei TREU927]SCU72426.1 Programmed cell death protein 2, C-terminal putative domain containing protein, putative [Trypanosoma equiperdum]